MLVSLIVAVGHNLEIGNKGKLLWKLPAELQLFKKITMGHTLIMGRKTYASIGRPLPGRTSIVLSRQRGGDEVLWSQSLQGALELAHNLGESEAFVIGGGQIYAEALNLKLIQKMYITEVDFTGEADTFFPKFQKNEWRLTSEELHSKDELNPLDYVFKTYERVNHF